MNGKRITIFCGHYGSGKTNIAVNYAFYLKDQGKKVLVTDLDIINPFFRTKDSEKEFSERGIELISPEYANSSLDVPTLSAETQRIITDKDYFSVVDVGGDERGSVALGGFAEAIKEENNYEMIYVVNFYRPHTKTAKEAYDMLLMIENVCGLKFTSIINNSCVGVQTTQEDVLSTIETANELSEISGLPITKTSVKKDLAEKLEGKIQNIFPLELQEKYFRVTGIK